MVNIFKWQIMIIIFIAVYRIIIQTLGGIKLIQISNGSNVPKLMA